MSESACSELPGFQIFDQAPTALSCSRLSADGQAGPTHWNRAWLSAFGYAAADVQGLNGRDFQLWHDPQELVERLLFGLTTSRHQRALLEIFDHQRQLRHVEVAGRLMEQRDQRYLILSYQDRTAQLAQTDKLHEYRTMVLTSNDGMFLAENKCIVECNEAAERFFQLPRNKLLQADPLKLAPLEPGSCPDMERARTAFSLASQGAAQSFKWEHTLPNGKWFCADIVLTPVHNLHTNEPQRFVGVIRNVTEARRTARNLAINAERFRKLFELAPVPLMLTTHDGRISSVNRQFERIFGYEASELLTLSQWRRLAYPDPNVREQLRERTRQLNIELDQAKGTVLLMEVTAQRKDGQSRVMQASIGRLENETLTAYLDITDIRQAHHALQSLNAELEQRVHLRTAELQHAVDTLKHTQSELVRSEKLASLGSLVAGIAHELNTPIGNAVMVASTLSDLNAQFASSAAQGLRRSTLEQFLQQWREATDVIERNLRRAAELISSFKQVAVDQSSYQRRSFDLAEVLHELRLTLSPTLRRAQVQLIEDLSPGLRMDSFPGPLTQVLMNIVNNAVLHAFDGRSNNVISIRAHPMPDQRVQITVHDNGCGIPDSLLPRIFDPFFTTKLGKGGSGLGLHIVHSIVSELLGGSVSVTSSHNAGSTFSVCIPCAAPKTPIRSANPPQ